MALIQLNTNPSDRELQTFGYTLPFFVGFLCVLFHWRTGSSTVVWGIGLVGGLYTVLFLGITAWRKPLFLGWLYATYPIGWVIGHTVMLLVYGLILTPIGWILRLAGRDPLQRTLEKERDSYWEEYEPTQKKERYFQQF